MKKISLFSIIMASFIGIIIFLAFLFPVKKMFLAKNDRLLEQGLNDLSYEISNYYQKDSKLPESLSALTIDNNEAEKIVQKNLVRYKVESVSNSTTTGTSRSSVTVKRSEAKYQLCVTYKYSHNTEYASSSSAINDYDSYLSTYSHPAGEVCYKLKTY